MPEVNITIPEGMTKEQFTAALRKMVEKTNKDEGEPIIYKEFPIGDNQIIRVERSFYKGRELLAARKY